MDKVNWPLKYFTHDILRLIESLQDVRRDFAEVMAGFFSLGQILKQFIGGRWWEKLKN